MSLGHWRNGRQVGLSGPLGCVTGGGWQEIRLETQGGLFVVAMERTLYFG